MGNPVYIYVGNRIEIYPKVSNDLFHNQPRASRKNSEDVRVLIRNLVLILLAVIKNIEPVTLGNVLLENSASFYFREIDNM